MLFAALLWPYCVPHLAHQGPTSLGREFLTQSFPWRKPGKKPKLRRVLLKVMPVTWAQKERDEFAKDSLTKSDGVAQL